MKKEEKKVIIGIIAKHRNINQVKIDSLIREEEYVHSIKINKDSRFYSIIKKEEIMVNSRHKNSIKECPGLNKVAFCEDGYPDVIEDPTKSFYIGVRFHPESLYKKDENMNNIFKIFLEECKKQKKEEFK